MVRRWLIFSTVIATALSNAAQGDRVWAVISASGAMVGSSLFAFDMSDPDQPRYKWSIGRDTYGFEQLALTFSTPRIAHLLDLGEGSANSRADLWLRLQRRAGAGTVRFGKDAGDDADTSGNAIYVVRADTGVLVWKAVGPGARARSPRLVDDFAVRAGA